MWPCGGQREEEEEEVSTHDCQTVTVTQCLRKDKEKEQSLADLPSYPLANWLLIVYRRRCWCSPVPIKLSTEQSRCPLGLVIVTGVRFGWDFCSQHENNNNNISPQPWELDPSQRQFRKEGWVDALLICTPWFQSDTSSVVLKWLGALLDTVVYS